MTASCSPTSFFVDAFRVVCWQLLEFSHQRAETLHPDKFNCLRCKRTEKDVNAQPFRCPKCELSHMEQHYREEIIKQVLRFYRAWPKGWTLDGLIALHGQIAQLVGRRKRSKLSWPLRLARLTDAYLNEAAHRRAVSDFESLKRMQAIGQSSGGGAGVQVTQISRRGAYGQ